MSAYIPTNVISITDGQIYLETEAFNAGIRPAINAGLSVSRVGGSAQTKAMRKIAGPLRTELAQYRELASFAQFSSDLDKDTRDRLNHGERIVEIMKQEQYAPATLEQMILIFFAATNRFFTDTEVGEISEYQKKMVRYFERNNQEILTELRELKDISPELEVKIKDALEQFKNESQGG